MAELIAERRVAPVDPLGRLLAARRPDRRGDGRRRPGDPLRRHGRPFRAADHDRAAGPRPRSPTRSTPPAASLDVHLMIAEPERQIEAFAEAGADSITFHEEATPHANRTLAAIRELGCLAGIAINPGTPVETLCRAARARRHRPLHDRQPRLGRPVLHPGLARQGRPPRRARRRGEDRGRRRHRRRHRRLGRRRRRLALRRRLRRLRRRRPGAAYRIAAAAKAV